LFALFFLAPDLSFSGYLAGLKFGSIVYNAAHSYIGVIVCLVAGALLSSPVGLTTGIIWGAHIGFDRFLATDLNMLRASDSHTLAALGKPGSASVCNQDIRTIQAGVSTGKRIMSRCSGVKDCQTVCGTEQISRLLSAYQWRT